MIDALLREENPHCQVNQVRAHVGEPFALLIHVKEPARPT